MPEQADTLPRGCWSCGLLISVAFLLSGTGSLIAACDTARVQPSMRASGLLDEEYRVYLNKRTQRVQPGAHVTYRFSVDDVEYTGRDRLDTEPTARDVIVFYDPENPRINGLRPDETSTGAFSKIVDDGLAGLFGLVVGLIGVAACLGNLASRTPHGAAPTSLT